MNTQRKQLERIAGISLPGTQAEVEAQLRQRLAEQLSLLQTAVMNGANACEDVHLLRVNARNAEQALRLVCPKPQPFKAGLNMRKVGLGWMLSYLAYDEHGDSRELRHVHLVDRDGWWIAKNRSGDILLESRSFLECCRKINRDVEK